MNRPVDERREIVLEVQPGVFVPALKAHLDNAAWSNPRPEPHTIHGFAACRNRTIKHNDEWYVVFTDTVPWDDEHMITFTSFENASAFLKSYRQRQAVLAKQPDITILRRVDDVLRHNVGTPNETAWDEIEPWQCEEPSTCDECGDEVSEYFLCLDGGDVLCTKHVMVVTY